MKRTILITGCSSGIGLDAAHTLNQRGWRVFASCRKETDCAKLRAAGLDAPKIDVADPSSISTGLAEVLEATQGRLDALFNNAAFAVPGALEDVPRDALRDVFETNLFGLHELTRLVIPMMRTQGHGRIINCSSVLGFVPMPWRGAYVSTKYAVEGLTDTLRIELRDTPIRIITLQPGPITSNIRKNSIPHFERWIDQDASARRADYARLRRRLYESRGPDTFELPPSATTAKLIHALESPRPRVRYKVTTATYVMATLKRLLPAMALDWIIAKSG
ncbi:MAG: SDR family NAD(P)-dependent oxidoreductase [Pseudomonadota bacterium]